MGAGETGKTRGEFVLVDRIRRLLGDPPPGVVLGAGDDCAALVPPGSGRLLLVTCDSMVEDRHFARRWIGPEMLGRKLATVNLSDVAAMGGDPRWAVLSLVLPSEDADAWSLGLARGVREELARHGAFLVGGNLAGTSHGVVADLTLVGEVEPERLVRRSGAQDGDVILVTGSLGASAAGLRLLASGLGTPSGGDESIRAHLEPSARVREGAIAANSGAVTAMVDLSDGLASDLPHLSDASGVGAEVRTDQLPIAGATHRAAAALGLSAESLALSGGEDYELLLTVRADAADGVARQIAGATGTAVTRIGRIVPAGAGIRYVDGSGRSVEPPRPGWDHFA